MDTEIIKRVETQIVDLPLKRIHKFSATSITSKAFLIVRIYSANGLMGVGEATTPGGPWWAGESIESIKVMIDDYFSPCLIDEDALNINHIMAKLNKVAVRNTFAKAAIEMSLFDIKGKALGVPMYQLLGGLCRESSQINWALAMGDTKADIEEAQQIMDANIAQDFKVKMGYMSAEDDVNYLKQLCQELGDKATVFGDLNAAWDESQARRLLPELEDNGMSMIEQPIQSWNRQGMARLRDKLKMPMLADESVCSLRDAQDLIQLSGADAISLKPLKSGGLLVCQQIAAMAGASGVACYGGTFLESSIGTASFMHLVAATPNIDYGCELIGPIWLADDLVQEPVEYRDKQVWVKHGPGLGIDLDENKVKHYLRG